MQIANGPVTKPCSLAPPAAAMAMASGKGGDFPGSRPTLDALPSELLGIIARKLVPADYAQFSLTNRRLRQVLADPVMRKAMVDATVRQAITHGCAVTIASRLHAPDAAMKAMEFLAGAWSLLARQRVPPGAGLQLWEKLREKIERLAHEQCDGRPNLAEDNQLLIAGLQRLAAALPSRPDTMLVLGMQELCLALARQAMRRVGAAFRAPLLNLLMDLLPLVPDTRYAANNLHGLKMMAAQLDPPDCKKALARLAILAPRDPSLEAALLDLAGPLHFGLAQPAQQT
jgi:hypothetical protein